MTLEHRPPSFGPKHDRVLPDLRGGAVRGRAPNRRSGLPPRRRASLRVGVEEIHSARPPWSPGDVRPRRRSTRFATGVGQPFRAPAGRVHPRPGPCRQRSRLLRCAGRPREGCGRHQLPMTAESQQRHPDLGVRHSDRSVSARGHRVRTVGAEPDVGQRGRISFERDSEPSVPRLPNPSDAVGARWRARRRSARTSARSGALVADERPMRSPVRAQRRIVSSAAPVATRRLSREIAARRRLGAGTFAPPSRPYVDQPSAVAPTSTASVPSGEISAPSTSSTPGIG